jgi:RNase P/RNase MRP subunit p29
MKTRILLGLALAWTLLHADTIYFKNGATIEGKIIEETGQTLTIERQGVETTYAKIDVAKIAKGRRISPPPPPPKPTAGKQTKKETASQTGRSSKSAQSSRIVTLRAGTKVFVELSQSVDSRNSRGGQEVTATLRHEIVADDGTVLTPKGGKAYLRIVQRKQAGRMAGRSSLGLQLVAIEVKGKRVRVDGTALQVEAKTSQGRDTAKKAIVGAGIGALVDRDHGKGARTGALVGLGAAALTKGRAISIPAGTTLDFTLRSDLKFRIKP